MATEEDDRDEDGMNILQEIARGAESEGKKEGKSLYLKPNREDAIGFALTLAKSVITSYSIHYTKLYEP